MTGWIVEYDTKEGGRNYYGAFATKKTADQLHDTTDQKSIPASGNERRACDFGVGGLGISIEIYLQKVLDYWCMMLYYLVMGSTERPETKEQIMKTNHPLAKAVADEIGCGFCWLNADHTEAEIDCTAADFAEFLPDVEGRAPSNFNRAAYDRLQNEGHSEKRGPRDPVDEFDAGRE